MAETVLHAWLAAVFGEARNNLVNDLERLPSSGLAAIESNTAPCTSEDAVPVFCGNDLLFDQDIKQDGGNGSARNREPLNVVGHGVLLEDGEDYHASHSARTMR